MLGVGVFVGVGQGVLVGGGVRVGSSANVGGSVASSGTAVQVGGGVFMASAASSGVAVAVKVGAAAASVGKTASVIVWQPAASSDKVIMSRCSRKVIVVLWIGRSKIKQNLPALYARAVKQASLRRLVFKQGKVFSEKRTVLLNRWRLTLTSDQTTTRLADIMTKRLND